MPLTQLLSKTDLSPPLISLATLSSSLREGAKGTSCQREAKSLPYGCGKNRGAHTIQSSTCEIILFKDWSSL